MSDDFFTAYKTLTLEQQKTAQKFVFSLTKEKENTDKKDYRAILDYFAGSVHSWDGLDPVEYQRKLREDRDID